MKNKKIIKSIFKIGIALAVVFSFSKMKNIETTNSLLYDKDSSKKNSFTAGTWGDERSLLPEGLKVRDEEPEAPVAGTGILEPENIVNPDPEIKTDTSEEKEDMPGSGGLSEEPADVSQEEKTETIPDDKPETGTQGANDGG
jgi:hypothetical protein